MSLAHTQPAPLAYSIDEASRVTTIGRTRLYELIRDGSLTITKVGKRTLIPASSLRRLVGEAA